MNEEHTQWHYKEEKQTPNEESHKPVYSYNYNDNDEDGTESVCVLVRLEKYFNILDFIIIVSHFL